MHPVPSLQVLKVLHHMYVNTKEMPIWNELNAEVLTADELCGFIHQETREWKNGKKQMCSC